MEYGGVRLTKYQKGKVITNIWQINEREHEMAKETPGKGPKQELRGLRQ